MYVKVFSQIFDSSIASDYRLRHFFMDMLVLSESDGVVDMTQEAIAARTRMPLAEVVDFLDQLQQLGGWAQSECHPLAHIVGNLAAHNHHLCGRIVFGLGIKPAFL